MHYKHALISCLALGLSGWSVAPAQTPAPSQGESHRDSATAASLTEFERSLLGTWYYGGDPNQPCYITSTDNVIFTITQDLRAARIVCHSSGYFQADDYEPGLRVEVSGDKLLWSNGTWWSRRARSAGSDRAGE
jgi:hypothetical protein